MKVSAVLLAAGTSSRMGTTNKLLLPFGKEPLFLKVYQQLVASEIDEVLVVTGFDREKIENLLNLDEPKLKVVYNENFELGMTSSIQIGVQHCNYMSQGLMICLSDMPFLQTADYNKLLQKFKENSKNSKCIVVPEFQGKQGNPILFSIYYKNELLEHQVSTGCKAIIQQNSKNILPVLFDNPAIMKDIDTFEMYQDYQLNMKKQA